MGSGLQDGNCSFFLRCRSCVCLVAAEFSLVDFGGVGGAFGLAAGGRLTGEVWVW